MNEENTRKLFTNFDRLFRGRAEPYTQTRMREGFACGDGWFDLIYQLCVQITEYARKAGLDPKALQVKEKFGCLCFYVCGEDETIESLRSEAMNRSQSICEVCGDTGTLHINKYGWHQTICLECRKKSARRREILEKLPQPRVWPFEKKYIEKMLNMYRSPRNQT